VNLFDIPLMDQHAHNLLRPDVANDYPAAFTEAHNPEMVELHTRHTLFYRRSLREIAALLECDAQEQVIIARRDSLGLEQLTKLCFRAANLEAIFLDDGLQPDSILPISWHEQFICTKRILRLEVLAEQLIGQTETFEAFLEEFRSKIDPPPSEVVAFKSIACYRTGLNIQPVSLAAAATSFYNWKQQLENEPLRLTEKHLIDFLLQEALLVAAKHRLPVQLHTGFGDPDLDLRLANPVYLRPLLESPKYRNTPLVLLHASYPYMQQAGYLASVYPQVYLDFGLAIPFLSVSGMRETMRQLLELTPTTKLMYSSDAHSIPELYYLGAKWGRQILGEVLDRAIADSDLTTAEAEDIALAILHDNACGLYSKS
jgi:uncharacterized protein